MLAEVQQFFAWKRSSRRRIKINAERIYRCAGMHDLLLVSSPALFRALIAHMRNEPDNSSCTKLYRNRRVLREKKNFINRKSCGPRQSSGRPIKEISAGTAIFFALARKTSIPDGTAEKKRGGILSNPSRGRVYRLAARYLRRVREITPARVQSYFLCSSKLPRKVYSGFAGALHSLEIDYSRPRVWVIFVDLCLCILSHG